MPGKELKVYKRFVCVLCISCKLMFRLEKEFSKVWQKNDTQDIHKA